MLAEIITIGDEILIGQTIDTNSAWLGKELNNRGVDVIQISSINDNEQSIINALDLARKRADLILITGGLGPTKDDITKATLAKYFNTTLVENKNVAKNVEKIFKKVGRKVLVVNKLQAMVPANCTVINNIKGTAPGMLFNIDNKIIVSMPGVPYEMKAIMSSGIFPLIETKLDTTIIHRTISIIDIPESHLSEMISKIEASLPSYLKLAYLPHLNIVRLRLTGKSSTLTSQDINAEIDGYFDKIKSIIGKSWFNGDRNISSIIGEMLIDQSYTLGTVESCTGGFVSHTITAEPGSSAYYHGSLITYAYKHKVKYAHVDKILLWEKGAVSEEVVFQMAKNGQEQMKVDYCISTSGIAGPSGATETKPIGLVYIALATPQGEVIIKECRFRGSRKQVIERTTNTALNLLREHLLRSQSSENLDSC